MNDKKSKKYEPILPAKLKVLKSKAPPFQTSN
jgi:hypothetical protein